jgi:hypothetical protein
MNIYREYLPDWVAVEDWTPPTHDELLLVTYQDDLGAPQVMTAYYQAETTMWALHGYYAGYPHAVYTVEYYGKTPPSWWTAIALPWEPIAYGVQTETEN